MFHESMNIPKPFKTSTATNEWQGVGLKPATRLVQQRKEMNQKNTRRSCLKYFPLIEGISIFVGIVAWEMFSDGRAYIARAALIAVIATIIWFGIRYYRNRDSSKPWSE